MQIAAWVINGRIKCYRVQSIQVPILWKQSEGINVDANIEVVPYRMLFIGQRKIIILGSVRHNYIRSKLSQLTVRYIHAVRYFSIALHCFHASVEVSLPALFRLEPTELVIEFHFSQPPFSRTSRTSLSHCRPSASSAFEELDPATQYR